LHTLLFLISQAIVFPAQPDIYLEVVGNEASKKSWVFFAPHEDEFVANQYVAKQVHDKGGLFVVLRQHGDRLITFTIEQTKIKIDPNRIFTDLGRKATIKKLNPLLDPDSKYFIKANDRANKLSKFILQTMGTDTQKKTWVAMHNNTNGYDNDGKNGIGTVSIVRYQHKLNNGAKYLINVATSTNDEDDLYFVTSRNDFNVMKDNSWNVVLQNPDVAHDINEDDGSLSVYAEMKGFRYINIEAERTLGAIGIDHLQIQKQMVDFTFSLLE